MPAEAPEWQPGLVGADEAPSGSERPDRRHNVVVVGGGVAGLEALLGLHEVAAGRVELTLVSPRREFVYRPMLVEEPFGPEIAERRDLTPAAEELGVRFVCDAVAEVDPAGHTVSLTDGADLGYDSLVVCPGAVQRPAFDAAATFPAPEGAAFRIDDLLRHRDGQTRIAFVVPPGATWALPIYELALMTERRARDVSADGIDCVVVTPESAPLIIFGVPASEAVAELLSARGVEVELGAYVRESRTGVLTVCPADHELDADAVVALPELGGPRMRGLPCDEAGFIPIDDHARVTGVDDVYAAGDATNFPIKQGGLGTQQADAAAEHIAQRAGVEIEPASFHPTLRGTLLTGSDSVHMRHEITGGAGEGTSSPDVLWWPPHKVASRYLSAWLAHERPSPELEPPSVPLDVEVALPKEWHEQPMAYDVHAPIEKAP